MRGLQCVQGLQYIRGLRCVPDLAMVPRVLMSSSRLRPTCSSTPAQPLRHGSRQDALPAAARLRAPQADGRLGPWPKPGRAMCRLAARSRRQSAGGKKLGQPEASRKATESRQAATHPRVLDHNRVGLLVGADTDLQLCRRRQHCANAQQADPPPAKPAPYPPTHAQHRPHTCIHTHTARCPTRWSHPPLPVLYSSTSCTASSRILSRASDALDTSSRRNTSLRYRRKGTGGKEGGEEG